jgi:hypothetical protein
MSLEGNKGEAALKVREILCGRDGPTVTVGLGDRRKRHPPLKTVDRPYIIRKHDGSVMAPQLKAPR